MLEQGKYAIECKACGEKFAVSIDEASLSNAEIIEETAKPMGSEITYRLCHELACPKCGINTSEIELREYPEGNYAGGETA